MDLNLTCPLSSIYMYCSYIVFCLYSVAMSIFSLHFYVSVSLEGSYTSFPIYMLTIYDSDLALLRYYTEAISADE